MQISGEIDTERDPTAIPLDSFLPYQITFLADRITRETAAVAKRHDGLNVSHWRVMAALADQPGRTANAVVSVTPMDKGIVSRAVKTLIDMGYVLREASATDGRIGYLYLTPMGLAKYRKIAHEIRKVSDKLTNALSGDEQKTLSKILSLLTKSINP